MRLKIKKFFYFTGYFSADLEPGNYAFVSEVPNSMSKNMLKTFVVKDE